MRVQAGVRVPLRGPDPLLRRSADGRGVLEPGAGETELVRHVQVPPGRRQWALLLHDNPHLCRHCLLPPQETGSVIKMRLFEKVKQ